MNPFGAACSYFSAEICEGATGAIAHMRVCESKQRDAGHCGVCCAHTEGCQMSDIGVDEAARGVQR